MLVLFSLFTVSTNAATSRIDEKSSETFEEKFISSNRTISLWFDSVADGLDLFLVGKRITKAKNESYIRIENNTYSQSGVPTTNETNLLINPRLPNLEKYWNLKFTSYDEQESGRGSEKDYLRQSPRERNYGASLGLFRKFGAVRTVFQPRIELKDPLAISHSLAFESVADFTTYQINPKFEFYASASKGTGTFQALNFNFTLNKIFTLTLINEGDYEDKLHKYSVTNGFSFGQYVNENNAMAYSWLFFSNNRDNYHLNAYSISISWYHLLYKKILDFRLTPHVDYARNRDFQGTPGITFQISLNF
ncbi:MAG: hypothetical protein ABL930_03310 [Pseudobdellovibrio sp.]